LEYIPYFSALRLLRRFPVGVRGPPGRRVFGSALSLPHSVDSDLLCSTKALVLHISVSSKKQEGQAKVLLLLRI
jgi:hypothetical protein